MKTIVKILVRVVATILFYGLLTGCGDNDPPTTNVGAATAACPLAVGDSVQFTECGGRTLGGLYCVADCIHEPGDQSAVGPNCTLPIYVGAADITGLCVASCSQCQ